MSDQPESALAQADEGSSEQPVKTIEDARKLFPSRKELLEEQDGGAETPEFKEKENVLEDEADKAFKHESQEDLSDIEKEAMEKGWAPKKEFKGPEDRWATAREFVDRMKMMEKIDNQRKELNDLKKLNQETLFLLKKNGKETAEGRLTELLKQKHQAIEEQDIEKAEEYERKYNEAKTEVEGFKDLEIKQQANSAIPPEAEKFMERNKKWFNDESPESSAMKGYAMQVELSLMKQYPGWEIGTRLDEVERQVKSFFHDKFENPKRDKAVAVEGKIAKSSKNINQVTYDDLPAEAKSVIDTFYKRNKKSSISRDQYAQQLVSSGAVALDK